MHFPEAFFVSMGRQQKEEAIKVRVAKISEVSEREKVILFIWYFLPYYYGPEKRFFIWCSWVEIHSYLEVYDKKCC